MEKPVNPSCEQILNLRCRFRYDKAKPPEKFEGPWPKR
jgi:hypothetical protein